MFAYLMSLILALGTIPVVQVLFLPKTDSGRVLTSGVQQVEMLAQEIKNCNDFTLVKNIHSTGYTLTIRNFCISELRISFKNETNSPVIVTPGYQSSWNLRSPGIEWKVYLVLEGGWTELYSQNTYYLIRYPQKAPVLNFTTSTTLLRRWSLHNNHRESTPPS